MRIGSLNIRSLNTKYEIVKELITDEQLDVFSCQETWHCVTNDPILQAATPSGYQFIDAVRKDQPGFGGLCIFLRALLRAVN